MSEVTLYINPPPTFNSQQKYCLLCGAYNTVVHEAIYAMIKLITSQIRTALAPKSMSKPNLNIKESLGAGRGVIDRDISLSCVIEFSSVGYCDQFGGRERGDWLGHKFILCHWV